MKCRNVTFILLLGVLILFSMCKKDTISSPGVNSGGNDNNPSLVSFYPDSGAIDDMVTITVANYTGDPTT